MTEEGIPNAEDGPDFVFGGKRVISEDNWAEYEAQGVENVVEAVPEDDIDMLRDELAEKGSLYGVGNLLLGDAFDVDAGGPLRHKPGIGIYITSDGAAQREGRGAEASDQEQGHRPPILKLPDGRHIVARPGTHVEIPSRREDIAA